MKKQIFLGVVAFSMAIAGAYATEKNAVVTSFYRPNVSTPANCTSIGQQPCNEDPVNPVCSVVISGVGTRTLYKSGCTVVLYQDPTK
jgi:hypothetical protein